MPRMNLRSVFAPVLCSCVTALLSACSAPAGTDAEIRAKPARAADTAEGAPDDPGCYLADRFSGFSDVAITPVRQPAVLYFEATAFGSNIDGVMGFTSGPATGFDSLAIAVRFSPAGTIDVRNGDAYQADIATPYLSAHRYPVWVIVDLTTHTYSVDVEVIDADRNVSVVRVATEYAFRPSQRGVTSLDTLTLVLDDTPGTMQVCNVLAGQLGQ